MAHRFAERASDIGTRERPPAQKEREFVCGDGTAEVAPLRSVTAARPQEADLFFGLGSLRDDGCMSGSGRIRDDEDAMRLYH